MSIISDKLKSFDYYKNKLPLYLQNSNSFVDQFRIWHTAMLNSIDISDEMLTLLNIFWIDENGNTNEEEYLNYINELKTQEGYGETTDILDKLGALFGIGRQMTVEYVDEDSQSQKEALTLTDDELLLLIKAQIIRSYFDGSRTDIQNLYQKLLKLPIIYMTRNSTNANCEIYFGITSDSIYDYSDNIKKLFLSGLLNLESMGIRYDFAIVDLDKLLIWDKEVVTPLNPGDYSGWDGGVWAI